MADAVRVKRTPSAMHPYTATLKGCPVYGWGNTPAEARTKLAEQIARMESEQQQSLQSHSE